MPHHILTEQASRSHRAFRILRLHAEGGLGQVSVALDEALHREVALKEIQDRYADDAESRARFLLEAEITGNLEHPGIVPIYSLGHDDGRPFYVMQFIRGDSLKQAIERFHRDEVPGRDPGERTLALREFLGRFVAACNAIAYAHSRGVLHRDLKPSNIILGKYGADAGRRLGPGQADRPAGGGQGCLRSNASTLLGQRVRRDADGFGDRHTAVYEPGAGRRPTRSPGHGQRRLQPGGHPLLPLDRPGAVRGSGEQRRLAEGAAGRFPTAATGQEGSRPGLGGDLPEGDGPPARGPVSLAAQPGRGHRALARR